jgi:hypothetical protein
MVWLTQRSAMIWSCTPTFREFMLAGSAKPGKPKTVILPQTPNMSVIPAQRTTKNTPIGNGDDNNVLP